MRRILIVSALALAASACRGQPSDKQPLHLVPDMDWQPKWQPGEQTPFFEDGRVMRPLVEGTVAQGSLRDDEGLYRGMVGDKYLAKSPIPVDDRSMRRGQERYNIYCAPCHDRSGSGKGIAVQRGYPIPVSLTSERVLGMPDGQVYWTITNGVRNMPAYRKQIPVEDRWHIVAYVRALGRSQVAAAGDIPSDKKDQIEPEGTVK